MYPAADATLVKVIDHGEGRVALKAAGGGLAPVGGRAYFEWKLSGGGA